MANASGEAKKAQNSTMANGLPAGLPEVQLSASQLAPGLQNRFSLNLTNVKPGAYLQNQDQPGVGIMVSG